MVTDQPTQADRERALAVARNPEESGRLDGMFKDVRRLGATLLAIHAENERLRAHVNSVINAYGTYQSTGVLACVVEAADRISKAETAALKTQEPKMTETQAEPVSFIPFCAYESGDERCSAEAEPGRSFCARHRAALNPETQAETGPSDEELFQISVRRGLGCSTIESRRALWQAGRASLAGELAGCQAAETEYDSMIGKLESELEAEKAAHASTEWRLREEIGKLHEEGGGLERKVKQQDRTFRESLKSVAARQARVMPSREALAKTIYETTPGSTWGDTWEAADAVLRILAPTQDSGPAGSADATLAAVSAQPTGASSDPPDPFCGECPMCHACKRCGLCNCAQRARYVPSVGERAVLVASPDYTPLSWPIGRVLVRRGAEPSGNYILFDDAEEDVRSFYIHRDATWRRVEERPFCREAPEDS